MRPILILLAVLGVAACAPMADSSLPIATELLPAPQPSATRTLVIVLPGRADDGLGDNERGMAKAIHEAWPGADVLLTSATYAYYRDGKVVERLHEDVVAPALRARAGGVRQWEPGPLPAEVDPRNYQRQVWKHIREQSNQASRVWLACGSDDYLLSGARLLATTLPEGRFIEMPGSHDWRTWSRIGKTVFSQIRTQEPDTL